MVRDDNKTDGWLAPGEIAKKINIPESSLRRYMDLFSEFLISRPVGRGRKYNLETVGVLERIAGMYREGYTTTEIKDTLAIDVPMTIDVQPEQVSPPMVITPEMIMQVFQNIATNMENLSTRIEELSNKVGEVPELKKEISNLRNDLKIADEMREKVVADRENYVREREKLVEEHEKTLVERDKKLVEEMRRLLEARQDNKPWWKFW